MPAFEHIDKRQTNELSRIFQPQEEWQEDNRDDRHQQNCLNPIHHFSVLWKYSKLTFRSLLVRGPSFSHTAEDNPCCFNTSLKHLGGILNITTSIRRCIVNFESWFPEHTTTPLILIFLQSNRFKNEGSFILTFQSWPPSYDLCRYRCLGGIYSGCPLQIPPFCLPSVVTLGQSIYISELRNPLWSQEKLKTETDKSEEAQPSALFQKTCFKHLFMGFHPCSCT